MSSAIAIENLRKSYADGGVYRRSGGSQRKEALKGVSLDIPKGSFFGLLGPNGAGKSTIINIIAGLTKKTSGSVRILDYDIDKNPRESKFCIGIVPQEVVLDPFFNIEEMLEYHAGYYNVPKSKRRTDEIIEALGLSDKKHINSRRLSGGMKRRVLIAKALVHAPPILILDEPTAGVDVELRQQLWEYVRKLNRQGTTILLTTHYLEEAEQLCDHIAIIHNGDIIARDRTENIKKILDDKSFTIKLSNEISEVPEVLRRFNPDIFGGNTLVIRYKSGKININDIIYAVQNSGLVIKDLSTSEPDLEDIFRHLTRKIS